VTRRGDILQDAISESGPPRESTGPLYTQPRPLSEVRTTYSKVPGQRIPWPMSRTDKGWVLTRVQAATCALPLPAQAETRCYHVDCSP
jgi:hypothetical protein